MEPAVLDQILAPWAGAGMAGSVVIALAALNVAQWRRHEASQTKLMETIRGLHEERLKDQDRFMKSFVDMLTSNLATMNRMADTVETFERIVDRSRQ